ncbi:uncharacterized protein LOC142224415 [Haematobia irritans]|uniref:uncharacterized protein LOC142224415 n=1 Tax=Haematobia irritans TaxID=7368 RepID=UPI003F4F71FA
METSESENIEILNKRECVDIVKNSLKLSHQFDLISYRISRASADLVGFMGEYYKLKVEIKEKTCNDNLALQYFIKSVPLRNPIYRAECERKGFFGKESGIYERILPNIRRYTNTDIFPKSYLVRSDLLVLEDFSLAAKNLRQAKPNEEYSAKQYELFLQLLARLHAASLAWEHNESIDIGKKHKDILFELQLTTTNEWYTTGIKGLLYLAQNHPKFQYPQAQEFINTKLYRIMENLEEFSKPSNSLRNVLCHRDSWNSNIFWEYDTNNNQEDPIGCRIVDFQLMRYSPPAIDVLNFLYNSYQDSKKRDQEIPGHLQSYRSYFSKEIQRLQLPEEYSISAKEFNMDCQRALLPVLVLRAICVPLMKLPSGWADKMRAIEPENFDIYMNDDRREMFERVSQIDAAYREKIILPVEEVLKYFGYEAQ